MSLLLLYILITLPAFGGRAIAVRALGFDDAEGWALGRTLGLVVTALPAWWAGALGLAGWRWLGVALWAACTVWGLVDWRRRRPEWRAVARAEAVFVVCAVAVIWLRLARPDIVGQEKLMDLGIFATLLRAEAFPPPDMWLAGETLPYYYWGAMIWTIPLTLARVPLDLAYNLVVAAVGGLAGCLLFALGGRAAEGRWAGWLAAGVGLFAGTADGLRQLVAGRALAGLDLWHSSRQVADTITEWPLFTLWLGDLHPHLLSMPLALAAVLLAWQAGREGPRAATVAAVAVLVGVTWAANPWAMPPTLVGAALMVLCGDGIWHWPGREGWPRWAAVIVIAVGSWLAVAPFHLSFHPPFQGVAAVRAWTSPIELALWGGLLLLPAFAASWALLGRMVGVDGRGRAIAASAAAVALVVASLVGRPALVLLAALLAVLVLAAVTGPAGRERPAIALAALGVFLLAVPEVLHVVDSYGDQLHRMNTVFKCYIQAWLLLAIAFPALLATGLTRRPARIAVGALLGLLALPHPVGLAVQPFIAERLGIDGLAWLADGDRAIVRHLRTLPPGTHLVEAVGGAYTEYARISSASGVPALLGWSNHELVWRGPGVTRETERRRALVDRIYRSGDPEMVAAAVREAGVEVVVIGALERRDFEAAHLEAVRRAGRTVVLADDGEVVLFDGG
ncbi:MAG: DUF2298 domain-containing protein [Thermoanaerobaculales bacterium]|nr:DUF2298 domain-containing protein [Thermoanaerobaculales bacterium]